METLDRITIDPRSCLGQATNRGMRITVSVISQILGDGRSVADARQAYPELKEDVRQAMQYAAWLIGAGKPQSPMHRRSRVESPQQGAEVHVPLNPTVDDHRGRE